MNRVAAISFGISFATLLFACAIDIGPFFKAGESPENETAFRKGQVGLITPALNKADELIAFRYLSGLKLDDIDAMNAGLRPCVMNGGNDSRRFGIQLWTEARGRVYAAHGLQPVSMSSAFSRYRTRQPSALRLLSKLPG